MTVSMRTAGLNDKIVTKKEPVRKFEFASRIPCHGVVSFSDLVLTAGNS